MSTNASTIVEAPGVECFAECPYFEPVSGRCSHEFRQLLLAHLMAHPDAPCPMYDEWRAEQMCRLERELDAR